MRAGLWELYLKLQTEIAYGDGVAGDSTVQIAPILDYINRLMPVKPARRALLIGPGNTGETIAFRDKIPGEIIVLTAHAQESKILSSLSLNDVVVDIGDIHDMNYQPGAFDFIYASNVLEHCFAPYVALMECRRALNQNGIAYFVMPWFKGPDGGVGPFHLHCLTDEVWSELLRKTGFSVVDRNSVAVGEHGYYHYVCAAVVPPEPHNRLLDLVNKHKIVE